MKSIYYTQIVVVFYFPLHNILFTIIVPRLMCLFIAIKTDKVKFTLDVFVVDVVTGNTASFFFNVDLVLHDHGGAVHCFCLFVCFCYLGFINSKAEDKDAKCTLSENI